MRTLLKNIGCIQTPVGSHPHRGKEQGENVKYFNAAIAMEDGVITEITSDGKLPEGEFTGGNMMLLDKRVTINKQELGREIYALRKSPLRLANWLGWSFILKAVLRKLTLQAAEDRVSELLAPSKAIITQYAGIGMDVDKPSDLKLVEKYLEGI